MLSSILLFTRSIRPCVASSAIAPHGARVIRLDLLFLMNMPRHGTWEKPMLQVHITGRGLFQWKLLLRVVVVLLFLLLLASKRSHPRVPLLGHHRHRSRSHSPLVTRWMHYEGGA